MDNNQRRSTCKNTTQHTIDSIGEFGGFNSIRLTMDENFLIYDWMQEGLGG